MNVEQLKAKFAREGRTFTGWAKENGYSREAVYRVLNGFSKTKYGQGHEIAVKLGLKPAGTSSSGTAS